MQNIFHYVTISKIYLFLMEHNKEKGDISS